MIVSLTQMLIDHVSRGELLDLSAGERINESAMRSWGEDRSIPAQVIRDILRGRLVPDPDPRGVRLRGALITGRLNLENLSTDLNLQLTGCFLTEGITASNARLPTLVLNDSLIEDTTYALLAERLTTHALLLRGATVEGQVVLIGAHIAGHLDCAWAKLRCRWGTALHADGVRVGGSVSLVGGQHDDSAFEAFGTGLYGAIRLNGAHIGGSLQCAGARVLSNHNPTLSADGLRVDGDLRLGGEFQSVNGGSSGIVRLEGARVGGDFAFGIDPESFACALNPEAYDPAQRLSVNGLVYTGLPKGIPWETWLELLSVATPSYAAQPYQQLAGAHRAQGHDRDARTVLIAQRDDQLRRAASPGERAWGRLTWITLGYGYQPWRALLWLLAIVVAAILLATVGGAHGGLARADSKGTGAASCSIVDRVGVGLDLGLPLIKTDARNRCAATDTTVGQALTATGWTLQALAWGFATLFVAGFTSAIRKT